MAIGFFSDNLDSGAQGQQDIQPGSIGIKRSEGNFSHQAAIMFSFKPLLPEEKEQLKDQIFVHMSWYYKLPTKAFSSQQMSFQMHHLPEDQNTGEMLHLKILIIMLYFCQRDDPFWVVSRSYVAYGVIWNRKKIIT